MNTQIALLAALLLASVTRLDAANAPERWTAAKANEWYAAQPWLVGCNFLPSTAVNDVEMWQAESFDATTIERELAWAHDLGFNTVRVFLNYVVWEADADGLKKRFDQFLAIANKLGIRVMPTLFDDCNFGGRTAAIGKQPDPVPGVHNSRWVSSPPRAMATDRAAWGPLEKYVKDMVGVFASDQRVLAWELYNEPITSLPLVEVAFRWAREAKPSQPVTTTIWSNAEMRIRIIELSDVLCFHNYGPLPGVEAEVASLLVHGRPVLCTEWMARTLGSRFDTHLPFFKENKIACWNWGFVAGRMQTYIPQGRKPGMPEPAQWFHDILRKDGTPYDAQEVKLIKATTGRLAASTYINSVSGQPVHDPAQTGGFNLSEIRVRDPFILADQASKTYYLYAQCGNRQNKDGLGLGVEVYSSKDLVTWSAPVLAFERPKSGFWGGSLIWAPEVHQFGKSYYMFVTFPGREGGRGTQILRADRPEGPFQIQGDTANTPPEQQCLDGTPWIDGDGTHWLVYCNEWSSIKDGTVRAVQMADDWTVRKGESLLLFHASEAPWVRPLRPGCFVTDGPFLHRTKGGKLLMIWSSFRKGGDYAVGVAESESGSVKGPWRHSPDVLFGKDGGHGMIFRDFSGGLQLCLHQPNGGNRERAHFFKLNEDGGRLMPAGEP